MAFDARTGNRRAAVRVAGLYRIAAWRDRSWAITSGRPALIRISPSGRTERVDVFRKWHPEDVDAAGGRVWVVLSAVVDGRGVTELRAYDADSGRLVVRTRTRDAVAQLGAVSDGVWGLGEVGVIRFDTSGRAVARRRMTDAIHLQVKGATAFVAGAKGVRRLSRNGGVVGLTKTTAPVASFAVTDRALYVLQTNEVVARLPRP